MSSRPVSVVAALPEEIRHFCRRHALERRGGSMPRWGGRAVGRQVRVACTGVGWTRAGAGLDLILSEDSPAALLFVGTAGALSADLGIGDLLVAERVISAEDLTGEVPVPPSPWLDRAGAHDNARLGTLLSARRIVSTGAEKRELAVRSALDRDSAAVDMESYVWASRARAARLPFVIVRAVSDGFDEDLPLDLNRALRADGSLSRGRVLGAAVRRPSALPGLLDLRDRVKTCSRTLEQALVSILA